MTVINRSKSSQLFNHAQTLLPGGVNSPVRAFKSIGIDPVFIAKAKGAYIWDVDDNQYIDFVGSWGPMIHGHCDPDIEAAIVKQLRLGTSFGAPTELENLMAERIISLVPSIEMLRMVNSGTEAVMAVIRLARAFTTREFSPRKTKIIKFAGCYHGHADALLVQAGSGSMTLGLPDSAGVSPQAVADTIVVEYNDREALREVFAQHGEEISAVILEPIIGNSGFIAPELGYLEFIREITASYNSLLIFDEVMTGFRVGLNGAQGLYQIKPDLTTLGKVIGGGLPVGAYGGRRDIMSLVAPSGPMYQAGTLSGNPLAMAAGLACLEKLSQRGFYESLSSKSKYLMHGMQAIASQSSNPDLAQASFNYSGSMFGFFFAQGAVTSYSKAKSLVNINLFRKFYQFMLDSGIYFAPSAFEAGFMSASHTQTDLDLVLEKFAAFKQALA